MPYPVDEDTAEAIEAAKQHHVLTWEVLEESDDLGEWVRDSFVAEGKTLLPEGACLMKSGGNATYIEVPTEDEVRDLFEDGESFQKFLDGEDYSYGLADVSDAEYNKHYEAIVHAMKSVAQEGFVVEMPTVPHQFLSEAPLADGKWIDRYTIELAEWGARLMEDGFQLGESKDSHPLAWHRTIDQEGGSAVDAAVAMKLWQQTRKRLARFRGRTKEIDGRAYVNFDDYLKWRGRSNTGDLKAAMRPGMVITQWNLWVQEHGHEGEGTLAEVTVGKLDCHLDGYQYRVCRDAGDLKEEVGQRGFLQESLQVGKPGDDEQFRQRAENWRELGLGFLTEIYTLRGSIELINDRYFDGQQALFPAVAENFADLLALAENTVDIFNESLAGDIECLERLLIETGDGQDESSLTIDLAGLVENVQGATKGQAAYLVDMAKGDALDLLGETRRAWELVDCHV